MSVTFVPHLLPVNRGIPFHHLRPDETRRHPQAGAGGYAAAYAGNSSSACCRREGVNIRSVRCSNYCDIQLYADPHTGLLIVTSVIDNSG